MTFKYRLLLAVLLTLIAIGTQVALAQTKTVKKNFIISNDAVCNCNVSITPTIISPTICNLTNGSVILNILGGSGIFTHQWKNSSGAVIASTKDLVNAGAGYYFLELKDTGAPYCPYFFNYTLASDLSISATIKDNVGCTTANGAITVSATGGSGSYSYSWRYPDGSEIKTKDISGVKAGSYSITVTDTNLGCTLTRALTIKSNAQLAVTTNSISNNTSCIAPNGGVSVSAGNGSGQYNYTWYDLQSYGIASYSQDLTGVRGGQYSALVSDKISGCLTYEYFTLTDQTVQPSFTVTEVIPNTNCQAPFNGSVKLELSGTPGPHEVSWTKGSEVISTEKNPVGLQDGTYGLTITDKQTKCQTVVTVFDPSAIVIPDNSLPAISWEVDQINNNTICGPPNGRIAITIADPTTPYSYSWNGSNGFTSQDEDLAGLSPGEYELSITAGCNTPPVIEAPPLSPSHSRIELELATIISDPENNLDVNSFTIVDPPLSQAKASISANQKLIIDYAGLSFKGNDKLKIRACDVLNACTENLLTIEVEVTDHLIVYNAVAPNSSGDNRYMRIENLPENNRVYIFNRWGDVVFKMDRYDDQRPEKRFEGLATSGKMLPSGTYLYKIEVEGSSQPVTGYLSLKQ